MKLAVAVFSALGILLGTTVFATEDIVQTNEIESLSLDTEASGQTGLTDSEELELEDSKLPEEELVQEESETYEEDKLYRVYQGNTHLPIWTFESREAAISEAVKWKGSHIMNEGEKVWSYGDQYYKVYQKNLHLDNWSFKSKDAAVQEAVKWNNSHIMHGGERIWNYGDQHYKVYQGNIHLPNWSFKSREAALSEAVKWKNSHISRNGTVIWKETDSKNEDKPKYIAHAGGEVLGKKITNSKEAILNSLSKGIDHIEIDFMATEDNQYVLLHDWGKIKEWTGERAKYRTKEEFKQASEKAGLTALDLDELVEIMREYPKLKVVTDIKSGNREFLLELKRKYPDLSNRFIPQVYEEEQYDLARKLGFGDIIYSLYQVWRSDAQVLEFAKENNLFGVTIAQERAASGLPKHLSKLGIMTYCHTINSLEEVDFYKDRGVAGFYTDSLLGVKR